MKNKEKTTDNTNEKNMKKNKEKMPISNQGRAVLAFIRAAEGGHSRALVPLAVSLLTGVGLEGLGFEPSPAPSSGPTGGVWGVWDDVTQTESRLQSSLSAALTAAVLECRGRSGQSDGSANSENNRANMGIYGRGRGQGRYLGSDVPLGVSVLCWPYYENNHGETEAAAAAEAGEGGVGGAGGGGEGVGGGAGVGGGGGGGAGGAGGGGGAGGVGDGVRSDPVTRLALGLLHVAAVLGGSGEADAILSHR